MAEKEIKQITNRHIARTLSYLENCGVEQSIRDFVKSELWLFHRDICNKLNVRVEGEDNERNKQG